METTYKFIKPNPVIVESLRKILIPIKSINDLTGVDTQSISIYSDYGPDDQKYQTIGYYMTDCYYSGTLISELQKVKDKYKISERHFSYKGRKDALKKAAFSEWFNVVKNYPGLIYIIAYDNSIKRTKEYIDEKQAKIDELRKIGLEDKFEVYEKMSLTISFLTVIAPYLKSNHKIAWISDPDTLIDTPEKLRNINISLGYLCDDLKMNLDSFSLLTKIAETENSDEETRKFNNNFEELLSIPDLAASTISSSLHITPDTELFCPDESAGEILNAFAQIPDIEDYKIEENLYCVFGISKFKLDYDENGKPFLRHLKVKLIKK